MPLFTSQVAGKIPLLKHFSVTLLSFESVNMQLPYSRPNSPPPFQNYSISNHNNDKDFGGAIFKCFCDTHCDGRLLFLTNTCSEVPFSVTLAMWNPVWLRCFVHFLSYFSQAFVVCNDKQQTSKQHSRLTSTVSASLIFSTVVLDLVYLLWNEWLESLHFNETMSLK